MSSGWKTATAGSTEPHEPGPGAQRPARGSGDGSRPAPPPIGIWQVALWTGILVGVIYGPDLGDLAVRAVRSLKSPRLWSVEGAPPRAGALLRVPGSLDLDGAFRCPPGWLRLGLEPNDRQRVFAPVVNGGEMLALVEISQGSELVRESLLGEDVAPIADPLVRVGVAPVDVGSADAVVGALAQIRACPVPGKPVRVQPGARVPLLGTFVNCDVAHGTAVARAGAKLARKMLFTWLPVAFVLIVLRIVTRRRRGEAPGPFEPGAPPARAILRTMRGGLLVRTTVSVAVAVGFLTSVYGAGALWERAFAHEENKKGTGMASRLIRDRVTGIGELGTALVCGDATVRRAGLPVGEGSGPRLLLHVHAPGVRRRPVLVALPYRGPKDPVVRALKRNGRIPVHVYGYRVALPAPLKLTPPPEECIPLEPGTRAEAEAFPTVDTGLVVDPWAPAIYRGEIAGLVLLGVLVGGVLGWLWTLLVWLRGPHGDRWRRGFRDW